MTEGIFDLLAQALADRYRLERQLGAGGMATVYLAHDLRHDRQVAIKVLRPELAAVIGAERFLAEIKTTANLQHPHILPLFDSGQAKNFLYYVMPYIQGETLREKLTREAQLGIAEAVKIATDVADALEHAHQQGVIHRDIKPENILLQGGRPIVADFGIALAVHQAAGPRLTETGLSLGTPHYMSPEQATANPDLTNRSDVYSLGAMLYEMLAGTPPHSAPSAPQIVAKIVTEEPDPVTSHRKTVPPHVEAAVHTALQKLPADRFATARAFAEALANPAFATAARSGPMTRQAGGMTGRPSATTALAAFGIAAAALAAWGWLRPARDLPEQPPTRLAVLAPNLGGAATALQRQIELTPDGSALLYTAVTPEAASQTMLLPLDATEPVALSGAVGFLADYAVSPDGREFVGAVLDRREVYRYSISGGTSRPLPAGIGVPMWGAWAGDGSLWISDGDADNGIARVDPEGTLSRPFGPATRDLFVNDVLPDAHTALVINEPQGTANGPALLLDLRTGTTTRLLDIPMVAIHYTHGYLVYCLPDGTLEAVPFDARAKRIEGDAVQIARGVSLTGAARCQLAVADNGTVAYVPEEPRSLVFVDRTGNSRPATTDRRNFHDPAFSPDGRRLAVDFNTPDGRDVWVLEVATGMLTRATFDRDGHDPVWTPDGRSLLYSTQRAGAFGVFRVRLGSTLPPESLVVSDAIAFTGIWRAADSALVTVTAPTSRAAMDVVLMKNGGRGPIEPLVATRFDESYPALSSDGRWLAYVSTNTGRAEVYVQAVQAGGEAVQVSLEGGNEPVFGPDGREVFYRTASRLFVAQLIHEPQLAVASRRVLFDVSEIATGFPHANYDVSPDGRTFAMVRLNPSSRIMVIQNLPALVRKLQGGAGGTR